MDEINSAILRVVRREPRISYRELGTRVGLSANAAAERLRRLEAKGALRFVAVVDPAAMTGPRLVVLIDLRLRPDQDEAGFLAVVGSLAGVVEINHVSGEFDYLLRVEVSGVPELDALIRELKTRGRVADTSTRLVLNRIEPQRR